MILAEPFRQQHLDRLPQHLVALIPEHLLCLAVGNRNLALLVDNDHRVGGRLEQHSEVSLRNICLAYFANRACHYEAVGRLDRIQRNFDPEHRAILMLPV